MRFRSSPLRAARRDGQRGAAAIEFALAMFFLAPLLMGMMQYGYYFYVAMNVLEAQHQGLVAAARSQGVSCALTASAAQVTARTAAQTAASTAITTYLTNNGLNSVVTLSGTTPTCDTNPLDPTWTMTLIADFRPPLGRVLPWDKASPTVGYLRYTARTMAVRGNN
jgi:Flp pilus assembly protein TadG